MNTRLPLSRKHGTGKNSFDVTHPSIPAHTNQNQSHLTVVHISLPVAVNFLVMQERLTQQQKDAVEERASYKQIISGLQAELTETQRQLEKVSVLG